MTSLLSFPDVNVWLAIILEHHEHHAQALMWSAQPEEVALGFTPLTQLSVLRLLTTAAVMRGEALTMAEAWQAYDRLFQDDRVALYPEPPGFEAQFRQFSQSPVASPKVWADAYLLAFASGHQGQLVTFDRALENRGVSCLVLR
jgi:toxin-antitoxin system PIN domain toxin